MPLYLMPYSKIGYAHYCPELGTESFNLNLRDTDLSLKLESLRGSKAGMGNGEKGLLCHC